MVSGIPKHAGDFSNDVRNVNAVHKRGEEQH
jgi:hypothetical protein